MVPRLGRRQHQRPLPSDDRLGRAFRLSLVTVPTQSRRLRNQSKRSSGARVPTLHLRARDQHLVFDSMLRMSGTRAKYSAATEAAHPPASTHSALSTCTVHIVPALCALYGHLPPPPQNRRSLDSCRYFIKPVVELIASSDSFHSSLNSGSFTYPRSRASIRAS